MSAARARALLLAAASCAAAATADARILLVEGPHGPVWTNVPEPAGNRLPKPGPRRLPYAQLIEECAVRHGVDARLIEAVIACESDFDPDAVSSAGAQGLMQLMPATGRIYGLDDPFDAAKNVDAGTRHLGDLLKRFEGDWKLVAAAYNAGAGAVERHGGIPPYAETMHYVRKVQHYLAALGVTISGVPDGDSFPRIEGVSFVGGSDAPDPIMDWKPEPEPVAELEPPRKRGPAAVLVRGASGRAVFTNRPEVKAKAGEGRK